MNATMKIDKNNLGEFVNNMKESRKPKPVKRTPVFLNLTWGELFRDKKK